jgi:Glycosyl transferase family 2
MVCQGCWGDPSAARNEGLAATRSPWVLFWDADNVMPAGFVAAVHAAIQRAEPDVGVIYSDIEYVDESLDNPVLWQVPDCDYWGLREGNCIDTASAWRRQALELCGGWPCGFGAFEDYALALELTRRGWLAQRRPGPPIVMRQHTTSRMETRARDGSLSDLWHARSLAIVSLLAGRVSTYERWEKFLHTADLPRHTALYVVDNSADAKFTRRVHQTCEALAAARQLDHVSISVRPDRYAGPDEPFGEERHLHVARLYSGLLPRVGEDLVFTLEDDVEPTPDAIRRLAEQIGRHNSGNYAVVAGAYDFADGQLCAGRADGGWGSPIYWHQVSDEPIDVGCVGGGCTLWANWALAGQPVPFRWNEGLGWDASLCHALRRRGYGIRVHGGVRCTHHVHGVLRTS